MNPGHGAALVVLAVSLSGCGTQTDQPSTFRLDAIAYGWDGDVLVANITVTNTADYASTLWMSHVDLQEWTADDPGSETLTLTKFNKNIGAPDRRFAPHETLHLEIRLETFAAFHGNEGYYVLWVEFPSRLTDVEKVAYITGCFNLDTPEFYGKRADAPDCIIWDCSGAFTTYARPDFYQGPDCRLTPHTGP